MDPRALASVHAAGRAAFAAALLVAPGPVGLMWVGRHAAKRGPQVVARAMGARDLGLAYGVLRAVRGSGDARTWIQAATFADAVDLLATLRARDDIPTLAAAGVAAMAGSSVALGVYVDRALARTAA